MQLPYPNVRTPHLPPSPGYGVAGHHLPFRKGRGEKLRTPDNAKIVRHHPALSECGASRFFEARPSIARHVTI